MNRFARDCEGSSLVEFTLVFPIVILVALGTVDFTYMLHEWNLASKAAYRGARVAIRSNPVSSGITNLAYNPENIGQLCFNPGTGATTGLCPTVDVTCTSTACPNRDDAAFTFILQQMQQIFPRLQAGHIRIQYRTTGQGFVGRPGGLPMTVTVSIQCMTHELYFLRGLAGWAYPAPPNTCPAGPPGLPIGPFASTLPSEDMEGGPGAE